MRSTFSDLLTKAAIADDRILLLTGDHGYALFDQFRQARPKQFVNCGIAEQNMVGVAAGLAKAGFRPIVYGLAAFVPMRVLEQIKIDVCYESLPVLFIGDGAGVVYAQLGTSHQCTEDLAALRALPNLNIASPADRFELEYVFRFLLERNEPGYLRFGKADLGDVHQTVPTQNPGDLLAIHQADGDFAIIATGSLVVTAKKIAEDIGTISVWSVPSVQPLNGEQLQLITHGLKRVFVMEEHSEHGGLGGLVSEFLAAEGSCRVSRFGTKRFSEYCGDYSYLMSYHELDRDKLEAKIRCLIEA